MIEFSKTLDPGLQLPKYCTVKKGSNGYSNPLKEFREPGKFNPQGSNIFTPVWSYGVN